jgi:hypothetical protein
MQTTLKPETERPPRKKASDRRISLQECYRELVARDRRTKRPKADVSRIFDLGRSATPTNIANDKDAMIAEAVWEAHQKSIRRR